MLYMALMLLTVTIEAVLVATAAREPDRESDIFNDGRLPSRCMTIKSQLEELEDGLTDLLQARRHISMLLYTDWMRFFSGSMKDDAVSARRVEGSLQAQRQTLRVLTLVGKQRCKELREAARGCGNVTANGHGVVPSLPALGLDRDTVLQKSGTSERG